MPLPKPSATPPLPNGLAARLAAEELLDVFRRLPTADQENFVKWVSAGAASVERSRRSEILVHALGLSPLAWETRPELPNGGRPRESDTGPI
jgi:hypothetical protein